MNMNNRDYKRIYEAVTDWWSRLEDLPDVLEVDKMVDVDILSQDLSEDLFRVGVVIKTERNTDTVFGKMSKIEKVFVRENGEILIYVDNVDKPFRPSELEEIES